MAIRDYRDKRTADFVAGERVREFQAFARQAARGIAKLQSVTRLVELRNPPSNRFEALRGDALLTPGEPYDVEIIDYH